jgi:uncharacterized protein YecE (DUF72 family)
MEPLGEKLGPLLLQFPYLSPDAMASCDAFLDRLARFLDRMPRNHHYAFEVRNRNWLAQPLLDLLCARDVALALVDQVWMPMITQLAEKLDVLTARLRLHPLDRRPERHRKEDESLGQTPRQSRTRNPGLGPIRPPIPPPRRDRLRVL